MAGKYFNQFLLYSLLKQIRNALRSSRSRVVEKEDLTLMIQFKPQCLLKIDKSTSKVCTLKSVFPYRELNPGRLGEDQES